MQNIIAQLFDLGWICIFALGFIYNLRLRPDVKPIVNLALALAIGFVLTFYVTRAMFEGLQPSQQVTFQYLLWCAACVGIAMTVIAVQSLKNFRAFWQVRLVLILLTTDAAGNFLMHLDQNVVGLNDLGPPNSAWSDRWWLWYLYSTVSNLNNAIYGLILFLPVGMELGLKMTYRKLLKQLSSAANFFVCSDVERRIVCINDMLNTLPTTESKAAAQQALISAKELLYRADETGQDHSGSINLLLDFAALIAVESETAIKTNVTSISRRLWQRFKRV